MRVFRVWDPELVFGVLCDSRVENRCLRLQDFGNNTVLIGILSDVCGIQNYNSGCCFLWVSNLVADTEGGT